MSYLSAAFFSWVQSAAFYIDVHSRAVELLGRGTGRTWLDVGCGPGMLSRLARERGYAVVGLDRDPAMIRFARYKTRGDQGCRYEVGDLNQMSGRYSADVVSAASLLYVLPQPAVAIKQLWDCVRPGGRLLVIETTEQMTPDVARNVSLPMQPAERLILSLWAQARRGRAVPKEVFYSLPTGSAKCTPFLGGLLHAWDYMKDPAR